jgi:hypothetical protein
VSEPKFKDFLVDTPNPKALDATLNQMGAALIGGPDNFIKVDGHYVMRALGNPDYIRFACEHQGYCKVIGEHEDSAGAAPKESANG